MNRPASPLTIRRARPDLAAVLTGLAHDSKAHWGYPPEWIRAWSTDLTFSEASLRDRLVYAAFDGDRVVGVHALLPDGERCELEHFWVHPAAMGRGVGRLLFDHTVRTAREAGALTLEISSDPYARGFYIKMGCREVGRVPAPMEGAPDRYLPRLSLALSEP